jgi:hypothetical protein
MVGESSGGADDVAGEPLPDTEGEPPADVWARGDRPNRDRKADAGVVPFDDLHFHRYCDLVPVRPTERERGSDRGLWAQLRSFPAGLEVFPTPAGVDEADRTIHYLPSRDRDPDGEGEQWPVVARLLVSLVSSSLVPLVLALLRFLL